MRVIEPPPGLRNATISARKADSTTAAKVPVSQCIGWLLASTEGGGVAQAGSGEAGWRHSQLSRNAGQLEASRAATLAKQNPNGGRRSGGNSVRNSATAAHAM